MKRWATVLQPMPSTENQFGLRHDQLSYNQSLGKDNWMGAMLEKYYALEDFQKFHAFTDAEIGNSNAFATWLMDNCEKTDFNKARTRWGIVGDLNNSVITKEFTKDVTNFFYILKNMNNFTRSFRDQWMKEDPLKFNPFSNFDGL